MQVLDLFSGIGGFSLGLERSGMKTTAFCEANEFCRMVIRKHWPDIPIIDDIRDIKDTIDCDLICGGFPCQAFSTAARGRNNAFDWWPEMYRVIDLQKPKWVIAENVLKKPIEKAKNDLEKIGYYGRSFNIAANAAGADHKRSRWWLVAHSDFKSELYSSINAKVGMLPELCKGVWGRSNYARALRVSDGIPHRMDRIRSLGNSILPQIPEMIGSVIIESEQLNI